MTRPRHTDRTTRIGLVGECRDVGHVVVVCERCGARVFECACTGVVKQTTTVRDCPTCLREARPKPRVLLQTEDRRKKARRTWKRRTTDT